MLEQQQASAAPLVVSGLDMMAGRKRDAGTKARRVWEDMVRNLHFTVHTKECCVFFQKRRVGNRRNTVFYTLITRGGK
jgi:hypothetical protein